MVIRLDFWSDFTCPFCFLATVRLEKLNERHGVDIRMHSFQLRPPGAPAMPPHTQAMIAEDHTQVLKTLLEEENVEMHPGPIAIETRPAHIALQYAEKLGKGVAFHNAVMKDYWLSAGLIEDEDRLIAIARKLDLNLDDLGTDWEASPYAAAVDSDRALASQYGIVGAPAQLFGRKFLVADAQPYALLEDVLARAQKDLLETADPTALAS